MSYVDFQGKLSALESLSDGLLQYKSEANDVSCASYRICDATNRNVDGSGIHDVIVRASPVRGEKLVFLDLRWVLSFCDFAASVACRRQ